MLSTVSFMVLTNNQDLLQNWVNEWSLKDTLGHGADFRLHWIIHTVFFYKSGHMISRSKPAPNCSASWVCHACTVLGGPCISSGWLLSICDTPGRYDPSRIPGLVKRQPSHSLVADAVSVASLEQILAFCLWLSCTCLSASREAGFLSFGIC